MAKKLKDTDYLFISTYLHSRERDLLTGARMERMIEAPTAAEAAKVLQEIGYGEMSSVNDRELGAVLAQEQEKLFRSGCDPPGKSLHCWSRSHCREGEETPCLLENLQHQKRHPL